MTKVQQHLSVPENRLRYAFDFLLNHGPDFVDYSKCYNAIAEWSDKLDTSEAHYWWKDFIHPKNKAHGILRKKS